MITWEAPMLLTGERSSGCWKQWRSGLLGASRTIFSSKGHRLSFRFTNLNYAKKYPRRSPKLYFSKHIKWLKPGFKSHPWKHHRPLPCSRRHTAAAAAATSFAFPPTTMRTGLLHKAPPTTHDVMTFHVARNRKHVVPVAACQINSNSLCKCA